MGHLRGILSKIMGVLWLLFLVAARLNGAEVNLDCRGLLFVSAPPVPRKPQNKKACISASLMFIGGGDQDRTDDLLIANQTLSQLSYTPTVTEC